MWLYEWTSQAVLFATLDRWLADDDATYLHSASGHRAPNAVEAAHLGHATPWQRLGKRGAVQEIDPVPG